MMIPYGGFEFSTTINARPEKAKETDAFFDIVPGVTRRACRNHEKAGTAAPAS
ncbi:hypothetical protein WN982_14680 [Paraburkholderia sp. IMGN_8]|uniref:hypothetical protein n=1 Tax=Paraburkholderia sp. IMGN_8 TaxID=3136564 RepID=UPI0031017292